MLVIQSKKKADYNADISEIESKCITTTDYNEFTKDIVSNQIKNKNFVDKSAIAGFINNAELNKKVPTLPEKAELKAEQSK